VNVVELTYVAGLAAVPANLLEAARELIRVNWRPQRGGNFNPFDGGQSDVDQPTPDQVRLGFFVPGRVMELLALDQGPLVG
jgi:hypothetical protein